MQIAKRDQICNHHSPLNTPQITVVSGEEFQAETELCSGGWLNSPSDNWTEDKTCALNPTVCVAVQDAHPGDLLAVHILEIIPDAVGYTGFSYKSNPLASKILNYDWGMNTKTVSIDADYVIWNHRIKLPISPMIGTLGTAPAEETLSNARAGAYGGNMDVQEVCIGSTVYLPVAVEGALLHIGDVHAIQGDGEINCSGGIECRSTVRIKVEVFKNRPAVQCVRIENPEYIMTVASEKNLEESFYFAAQQLLTWICEDYGHSIKDAYLLMGQVLEARSTQFVNPTYSYICKMPKKYL